jgi:hypothetical protein
MVSDGNSNDFLPSIREFLDDFDCPFFEFLRLFKVRKPRRDTSSLVGTGGFITMAILLREG